MRSWLFTLALFTQILVSSVHAQTVDLQMHRGGDVSGALMGVYRDGIRVNAGEFGIQDLEWNEIRRMDVNGIVRLAYGDDQVLRGTIVGREGGTLVVQSDILGSVKLPVSTLQVAPAPEKPEGPATPLTPKDWTGKVALGVTATGGNSDTFTGSLEAFIERNFSHDHLEAALRVIYATADGEENANSQLARGKWEHYYSERFYSFFGIEIGRDEIQEVDLRVFANIGAGYTVWKDSDDEFLKLEGGIGYRHESFSSDTASRNDITARVAAIYDTIFFGNVDFHQLGEVVVPLSDPGSWIARSETVFSMPVAENWSFRNSIVLTYQGDPADDAESFDWLVTSGLEYTF